MNRSKKFFIGLLVILVINVGLLTSNVEGKDDLGNIVSKSSSAPIIDGYLNDTVWEDATPTSFTLYNYESESDTTTISVYSLYDSSSSILYVGYKVTEAYTSNAGVHLIIRSHATNEIVDGTNPFSWGDFNDIKYVNTYQVAYDYYMQSDTEQRDSLNGGQENINGGGHYVDGSYYFEMSTAFDSGDSAGHDFSIAEKGELEVFIVYTTNFGNEYSFYKPASHTWGSATLIIGKKGLPINLGILALFGLGLVVFIQKRRK